MAPSRNSINIHGAGIRIRGVEDVRKELRRAERDISNMLKREMRQALIPARKTMRELAPRKSGKLSSSVKTSAGLQRTKHGGNLYGKITWGGKASAAAIRRAFYDFGARGGKLPTQGRVNEAYYWGAVAKGHTTIHGAKIPANTWANEGITRVMGPVRRQIQNKVDEIESRTGRRV